MLLTALVVIQFTSNYENLQPSQQWQRGEAYSEISLSFRRGYGKSEKSGHAEGEAHHTFDQIRLHYDTREKVQSV